MSNIYRSYAAILRFSLPEVQGSGSKKPFPIFKTIYNRLEIKQLNFPERNNSGLIYIRKQNPYHLLKIDLII